MVATTQLLNVGRGSHEIAVDLSADQAGTLKSNKNVNVSLQPSTWIFFVYANDDPKISEVTSNQNFQKAIRYGLDYASIVSLAGKGAIQAPGVIPSMFLGSLPQSARVKTDVAKAKAALAASGVGDQKVTMIYPSDLTINGVPFSSMAQKVQSSLKASASTSRSRARRPRTSSTSTGPASRPSASRCGAPTTPIRPTTSSSRPASSSASAPAGRRAATRRSRSSPPRRR